MWGLAAEGYMNARFIFGKLTNLGFRCFSWQNRLQMFIPWPILEKRSENSIVFSFVSFVEKHTDKIARNENKVSSDSISRPIFLNVVFINWRQGINQGSAGMPGSVSLAGPQLTQAGRILTHLGWQWKTNAAQVWIPPLSSMSCENPRDSKHAYIYSIHTYI